MIGGTMKMFQYIVSSMETPDGDPVYIDLRYIVGTSYMIPIVTYSVTLTYSRLPITLERSKRVRIGGSLKQITRNKKWMRNECKCATCTLQRGSSKLDKYTVLDTI